VPFLGRIPLDPGIVENCDEGKPFVTAKPESAAAKAFSEITDRVLDFVNLEAPGKKEISPPEKKSPFSRMKETLG
jgi:MinD-like ATPase involved in chromosome partitioning or flagellar assembly